MAIDKNDYLDVNGDYDIKKELVDELIDGVNVEDTGWIELPLLNGNVAQSTGSCAYRKVGKTVFLRLHLNRANYDPNVAILPEGFRPASVVNIIGMDRISNEVSRGYVLANGNVTLGTFTQKNGFIVGQDTCFLID